jgi:foldase protein PrsA
MKPGGFEENDRAAMERLAGRIIETLIQQRVMLQQAREMDVAVTDAEVDAHYAQTQASLGGPDGFERKMRESKTDSETLREDIREFLTIQKLDQTLQTTLVVTEEEITAFFESNRAQLLQDHARVRHILVDSLEKAEDVLQRLSKDREAFAELAGVYSVDAGSRGSGGDLGWIARGQTEPEFDRAVFAMQAGDTSSPVRTRYGYHIIRVEDVQPAGGQTLADHRDHVVSILQQQKWQVAKGPWLETVAANTTIQRAPGIPTAQPPTADKG